MVTAQIHRFLMFLGGCVTGISGILIAAQVTNTEVTAWFVVAGSGITLVGNQMRVWWPKETDDPTQ